MKVKELIKELKKFEENSQIVLGSDEELNSLFNDIEISVLYNPYAKKGDKDFKERVVIYGLDE